MSIPGSKIIFVKEKEKKMMVIKFYTWMNWINLYRVIWIINIFLFNALWGGMIAAITYFSNNTFSMDALLSIILPIIFFGIISSGILFFGLFFIRFLKKHKEEVIKKIISAIAEGYDFVDEKKVKILITQFMGVPLFNKEFKEKHLLINKK